MALADSGDRRSVCSSREVVATNSVSGICGTCVCKGEPPPEGGYCMDYALTAAKWQVALTTAKWFILDVFCYMLASMDGPYCYMVSMVRTCWSYSAAVCWCIPVATATL